MVAFTGADCSLQQARWAAGEERHALCKGVRAAAAQTISGQRAPQVRDVGTQGLVTDRDVGSLG